MTTQRSGQMAFSLWWTRFGAASRACAHVSPRACSPVGPRRPIQLVLLVFRLSFWLLFKPPPLPPWYVCPFYHAWCATCGVKRARTIILMALISSKVFRLLLSFDFYYKMTFRLHVLTLPDAMRNWAGAQWVRRELKNINIFWLGER